MIRRPPRSTQSRSSAASDVYKRQLRTQTTTSTSCIPVVLPPSHTVTSPSITVPHSPIEIPQAPPSPIQAPHPSVVQPIPQFHLPGSLPPPFYTSSAFTVTPSAFVQPVIQSSASLYTPPSVAPAILVYPFCASLISHLNWLTYLLTGILSEAPALSTVAALDALDRQQIAQSKFWPQGLPADADLTTVIRELLNEYNRFLREFFF